MQNLLKPERFDIKPEDENAEDHWVHWYQTFTNFLEESNPGSTNDNLKLRLLVNYISPYIYKSISNTTTFDEAVSILKARYIRPKHEIYARHVLASRYQKSGESVDQYLQVLKELSKPCSFAAVSSEQNQNDYIRDAFIRGLLCPTIRQRLLESTTLTLSEAFERARSLELAQNQSEAFSKPYSNINCVKVENQLSDSESVKSNCSSCSKNRVVAGASYQCYFCGSSKRHSSRQECPAFNMDCKQCGKKGHFSKVCRSKHNNTRVKSAFKSSSHNFKKSSTTTCAAFHPALSKSTITIKVDGLKTNALVDTGSSETFISKTLVEKRKIIVYPTNISVSMASASYQPCVTGFCLVDLNIQGHLYSKAKVLVLDELCADVVLGHDIFKEYSSIEISFGGQKPPLKVCSLSSVKVAPVRLFENLTEDCKPIAVKSRRYSEEDSKFINEEVKRLLSEGVIEPSSSPWRAQVLVVKGETKKKRMCIDYSQTINRFTLLDAYPLPRVEDVVNRVSKYSVFSTIDLQSAYHQVLISEDERHYTAFEASGRLYHFLRIPFGVTNGVASFQRTIDSIIQKEGLQCTEAYLDDVTIGGKDKIEHDHNLQRFFDVAKKYNITFNLDKCSFAQNEIHLLGYVISEKGIRPDPDRLQPLFQLPLPNDMRSLRRAQGMFSHYSNFIKNFSEKVRPISSTKVFPLSSDAVTAFKQLKEDIAQASKFPIQDGIPFTVETDASDYAIGATLSQAGRPVAFYSKTLTKSEQNHSSVEKEAQAIVESLKKWRHFLVGRPFQLITDQKSVAFMFNNRRSGKIKNEKIQRWRLELSCYMFDISYRPGKENGIADTMSRLCASIQGKPNLQEIHKKLCHPGVTRFYHWIKTKNLPYSIEEVRSVVSNCRVCAELKPRYCNFKGTLIKATTPFERLNIDFKGPLPSISQNKYILTIVDEYSRYPFAFPCRDMTTSTVIKKLQKLFSLFGMPAYIHSDRGASLISLELKEFLTMHGIASSHSSAYNPRGNGQVEKYNGIIWKTISLALKDLDLPAKHWEIVISEALHSIRSLLCTATNATPHELMFKHSRRSHYGNSVPTWLSLPGPVLLRNHNRSSKYDPLVEEVELVEANPGYAHVRFPDGKEKTVSIRDLAPAPEPEVDVSSEDQAVVNEEVEGVRNDMSSSQENTEDKSEDNRKTNLPQERLTKQDRINLRPQRFHRLPTYLKDYEMF